MAKAKKTPAKDQETPEKEASKIEVSTQEDLMDLAAEAEKASDPYARDTESEDEELDRGIVRTTYK